MAIENYKTYLNEIIELLPNEPFQDRDNPLSKSHLKWMAIEVLLNIGEWSAEKTCRWIGFMQAGLFYHNLATLQNLRDSARDLGAVG